jgi:hypothetical protein
MNWVNEAFERLTYARSCSEAIEAALWLVSEAGDAQTDLYLWTHDLELREYQARGLSDDEPQGWQTVPPAWQEIAMERYRERADQWVDLGLLVLSVADDPRRLGRLLLVMQGEYLEGAADLLVACDD